MPPSPIPANDADRLATLRSLNILDTPPEERFDRITKLAKHVFKVPIVVVSLVDVNRQWFKSCIGLPIRETSRHVSFCSYVILQDDPLVIPDATKDHRFADNALVTGEPFIRFYAGMPLSAPNGHHIGTLCIIDTTPRTFGADDIEMLKILAKWVEREINSHNTSSLLEKLESQYILQNQLSKRYKFALSSAKIGVWEWDIVKNKLVWDEQMYALYGTQKEIFSGAYEAWQHGLHPDDRKKGDDEIQLALTGKKDFNTTFRVVWANGSIHWIQAHGMVERDMANKPVKMTGVNWDITDEIHAKEQGLQLAAIVRDSDEAIIGKTTQGIITSWNAGAEHLYGYNASEAIGKSIRLIVPPDHDDMDTLLAQVLSGKRILNYETIRQHKNGTLLDVSLTISPIKSDNGDIVGVSVIAQDISKQKRLAKAQSEFVSLASHQLRTPLTAIKWITSTLYQDKMGPLTDQQRDALGDAVKSVNHMNEIVSTMLMISLIETNNLLAQKDDISCLSLLKEIDVELQALYKPKHQNLSINCATDIAFVTDKKILKEILLNLMSNAVKYTPDHGNISCNVVKNNTDVVFSVMDSGYGIPEKDKQRIFQKFFRADNVISMQTEGTGLGLYLVSRLVKILGGTIVFTSELNKGSTFAVTLPLTPPNNAESSLDR